jgi:hypothetical protein
MSIVYPEELMRVKINQLEAEIESWKEIARNENSLTEKYKNGYDAAMRIVKSTYPDKFPDNYFICGELGVKDVNNMPEKLMVCPAYGCDFSYIYERTEKTTGPEW